MSKKGGNGGGFLNDFFNNPFGGRFDFNGNGREDLGERCIAHKLLDEITGEDDSHRRDFGFGSEDGSWRETAEDGSEYGVDPEEYEDEEEYEEALKEAKYGWRDFAEDGSEYEVDPEDYETEEEYEEALKEAKYGWRDFAEDGSEYEVDPEDYETEEEYEEALKKAKYGWRETAEDGSEYEVDPEDYETEEEYEEALEEAKYGWRETAEDGSEYEVDPEDYETEEEYEEALKKAKYGWRETAEDGSEYEVDPEDYETEEEYEEALEEAKYDWSETAEDSFGFGAEPESSETEKILREAKYGWRKTAEDGFYFDVDPEDYETEEEYEKALKKAKYGWRETAEDGSGYGLDPEDYEEEEDYEEALEEAKYGWRETAEDGSAYGLDPEDYETEEDYEKALKEAGYNWCRSVGRIRREDYPNRRRYNAAAALTDAYVMFSGGEYEELKKSRCHFILEQGDTVIAADYLTPDGDFLFSQAVKDHFDIPVTLPDEDEKSEFYLSDILRKIERKDVSLALNVWKWCAEQFLPYADYAPSCRASVTNHLLDNVCCYSDEFRRSLRIFLNEHADFRTKIIREAAEVPDSLSRLIVEMIRDGFGDTAKAMFEDGLFRANGGWKQINYLMSGLILYARGNREELETMEFVEMYFLPRVRSYSDGMIQDEVEGWEKEISEYKQQVERCSDKYAFSRSNAWRNHAPDGSEYGLNPRDYHTEQEYLAAIQKEKYAWREWCISEDTLGLDPAQFETEEEYTAAWEERYDEELQKKQEEQIRKRQLLQEMRGKESAEERERRKQHEAELLADKTIYTYCGVMLPFSDRPYSFRSDDSSIKIGEAVIVPVGEENREMEGIVVSIGRYARIGVPFPVEKTKFIIRKAARLCCSPFEQRSVR